MKRWKRWGTIVAVPLLSIIGIGLPTSVAGASVLGPSISGFAATPSTLTSAGGSVTLSGTAILATSCRLSASPKFAPLPVACTSVNLTTDSFPTVNIPPNNSKKTITYTFKVKANGFGPAVTATTTVTETPAPLATYVALGDSYSSGEGNPAKSGPQWVDEAGVPSASATNGCDRSAKA